MKITDLVMTMRPHQWVKNVVVLAALVFAYGDRNITVDKPWYALIGMGCFCLIASCVYIINDLKDAELDRLHPTKQFRPIAAGKVKPAVAMSLGLVCLVTGIAVAAVISPPFLIVLALYGVTQIFYTLGFKKIAVLDVIIIAFGFVLRALSGAIIIDVNISKWLLVCTFLLALFLGLSKRRHEKVVLSELKDSARPALEQYTAQTLDRFILLVAGATVMAYGLYTIDADTVSKFGSRKLALTVPLVALGLWRYFRLVYTHEEGGRPEKVLLTDVPMIAIIAAYGGLTLSLFFLR